MAYPGKRTGPRRDFKQRDYGDRGGDRGGMRAELHSAVCAECNAECQVPFKPNGKKPVLCGNCFKRDGGPRESRDSKPWERSERPSFGDRRAPRFPREEGRGNNDEVLSQLKAINEKLDALINALSQGE